jgi:hypothetical protein
MMEVYTHKSDGNGNCVRCGRALILSAKSGEKIGVAEGKIVPPVEYRVGKQDSNEPCVKKGHK